jgi:transposase
MMVISKKERKWAEKLRDNAKTVSEYQKALCVILISELGLDAKKVSWLLGTSRSTLFRSRRQICSTGKLQRKEWGGRRHCHMTEEEENAFLAPWESKATSGGVLSVIPIHEALKKRIGCDISVSTTYRLLARHNWRKVQPDTKHPKGDPGLQKAFKKNSAKLWLPPAGRTTKESPSV